MIKRVRSSERRWRSRLVQRHGCEARNKYLGTDVTFSYMRLLSSPIIGTIILNLVGGSGPRRIKNKTGRLKACWAIQSQLICAPLSEPQIQMLECGALGKWLFVTHKLNTLVHYVLYVAFHFRNSAQKGTGRRREIVWWRSNVDWCGKDML